MEVGGEIGREGGREGGRERKTERARALSPSNLFLVPVLEKLSKIRVQ